MRKRLFALVMAVGLATVGLPASAGAADEAVTIKIRKLAKGDVVKETKSDEMTETTNVTAGGQASKQEDKSSNKVVFTDEVLEVDGKASKPTKLKRTYETAEAVQKGKVVDLGLAGKTVLIEKSGDKYGYTIDGKAVGKGAADLLDREFNRAGMAGFEEVMIPKKAVKVGDTWDADVKEIAKLFEEQMSLDADKTKVSGKLLKVYDQGGAKYGVIEYGIALAVSGLKTTMGALDAAAGSTMTFTITVDGCIDGTQYGGTSKGKMGGEIGVKVPQADVKVSLDGKMESKAGLVKK